MAGKIHGSALACKPSAILRGFELVIIRKQIQDLTSLVTIQGSLCFVLFNYKVVIFNVRLYKH
jgi:hypothetical protein